MEIASLQPDRILVTLFVSVMVAFVTAALSIVRLVNDKEEKTTDYRQSWTDSLRKALAELVSNINALSMAIVRRSTLVDQINMMLSASREQGVEKLSDGDATLHNHLAEEIAAEGEQIRVLQRDLHQSYALTRLHFKPNDLSFNRIEQKFDIVLGLIEDIRKTEGKTADAERKLLKEKVHNAAAEITAYARDILKTEWENVKRGEPAYQRTKTWSVVGGAIALFILLIFGAGAAISYFRGDARIGADTRMSSSNTSGTTNATYLGSPIQNTPPVALQPQTSQEVNVYSSTPITCSQRRTTPSSPAVIQQQPCTK